MRHRIARALITSADALLSTGASGRLMLVMTACTHPKTTGTPSEPLTVIVLSFDALGDRFLDRDTLPNFARMMREGVRAPFRPEFPSKTFPNHYSMATGLTPGQHGIVVNSFFDPARGEMFLRTSASEGKWFGGEPIWVTAERAGHSSTAAYFWTGSEAEIQGVRPSYWNPFDATRPDSEDRPRSCTGFACPPRERPRLIMLYSPVVDVAGTWARPGVEGGVRRRAHRRPNARSACATHSRTGPAPPESISSSCPITDSSSVPREHDIDMDSLLPKQRRDRRRRARDVLDLAGPRWTEGESRFPRDVLSSDDSAHAALSAGRVSGRLADRTESSLRRPLHAGRPGLGVRDDGTAVALHTRRARLCARNAGDDGCLSRGGTDFRTGLRLAPRENRTLHELLIHLLGLQNPIQATMPDFGLR